MKTNQWNETEAPKDGTLIVALGGVTISDEFTTAKLPFCELIFWSDEHKEWLRWFDTMSLRRSPDDQVHIHFWMPCPQGMSVGTTTDSQPVEQSV
jgi:hypothetical protein